MEIFEEEEKKEKLKFEFSEGLSYSWRVPAPSFSEVVLGDLRYEDVLVQLDRWREPIPYYTREEIERLEEE